MSRKLLHAGTILNRYRIEKILGEGGFGVTYLAMEPVQQRYVAIKEYFPKRFANRTAGNTIVPNHELEDQRVFKWGLKRFLDEAKVLARLDHPNIVKVQRCFEVHGTAYLVMDYCDGKPLDKFFNENGNLAPRKVFQIYVSLINALEHVHQHGILHGDLKPSNILVRSDGVPVLLDFGSARQEMLRMAVGQVSDGYSPPEFYEVAGNIGAWSDIYGLGATFYKLITGVKVPVATDRLKYDNYVAASVLISEGYSSKFLELIDRSLMLSASDRPQSIALLRSSLPNAGHFERSVKILKNDVSTYVSFEKSGSFIKNWKFTGVSFFIIFLLFIGYSFYSKSEVYYAEVEQIKVQPILIEDRSVISDTTMTDARNVGTGTKDNVALQQAMSYLEVVSTSPEISWYSIPKTDLAISSFKFVMSEIDKQFDLAIYRKSFTYNEYSKEYVFKDFSLVGIKSLGFTATDDKCGNGPIGPVAGGCKKMGKDFKCRFVELPVKYEHTCLSAFSSQ